MSSHKNRNKRPFEPTTPSVGDARFEDRIRAAIAEAPGKDCYVCGRIAVVGMVWQPTPEVARQLGTTPGRTRIFVYALCGECCINPANATLVEDRIMMKVAGVGARFGLN